MSVSTITMIALASIDGLTVASAMHRSDNWPRIGEKLDNEIILKCARLASESGAVFRLQIISDALPSEYAKASLVVGGCE